MHLNPLRGATGTLAASAAALALACGLSTPAKAKNLGTFQVGAGPSGAWRLRLETPPEASAVGPSDPGLQVGKLITIYAQVVPMAEKGPPPPLGAATFNAEMPEHGHGMFTNAKVTEESPGHYRIDGVKLHMAGIWKLDFTVQAGGKPVSFVVPVRL
jgi:hypothetical protein